MTTLGKNCKITAPASARAHARAVFTALGGKLESPSPAIDVFALAADHHVAFVYVADVEALTPAQLRMAPWLELLVDDVEHTRGELERLGCERFSYHDSAHTYFTGPGGVVFRIAAQH